MRDGRSGGSPMAQPPFLRRQLIHARAEQCASWRRGPTPLSRTRHRPGRPPSRYPGRREIGTGKISESPRRKLKVMLAPAGAGSVAVTCLSPLYWSIASCNSTQSVAAGANPHFFRGTSRRRGSQPISSANRVWLTSKRCKGGVATVAQNSIGAAQN
jgi:hypothetical protein